MISLEPLLILGANGQVGRALGECLSAEFPTVSFKLLGRDQADLSRPDLLPTVFKDFNPRVVINAGAYTKVDLAEKEETLATIVNGEAPGVLARECAKRGIPFIHFSTDYVFSDSNNLSRPWNEKDPVNPVNAYGRSKLAGERAVQVAHGQHLIFRTSWVYDSFGTNFVNTMLRLGREREKISVVNDQHGAPTFAPHLALIVLKALVQSLEKLEAGGEFPSGVYHACGGGETTWFGFAEKIFEHAKTLGLPFKLKNLEPVPTQGYPTPAKRPQNSRLDTSLLKSVFGLELPLWTEGLNECFETKEELK